MSTTAYLGIDVGSVTTKVALVNEKGDYIESYMLRTAGKPVVAVQTGLRELHKKLNGAGRGIRTHSTWLWATSVYQEQPAILSKFGCGSRNCTYNF